MAWWQWMWKNLSFSMQQRFSQRIQKETTVQKASTHSFRAVAMNDPES